MRVDLGHDLIPVLYGHNHVEQNGGEAAVVLLDEQHGLFAVFRFQKIIVFFKCASEDDTVDLHVIHNEDRVSLVSH